MANSNIPYFITGIGIGAALGILFAPRPGEETREGLRRRADDSREYIRRRSGELREQTHEIIEQGRDLLDSRQDQLQSAFEAGRKAYCEASAEDAAGETKTKPKTATAT